MLHAQGRKGEKKGGREGEGEVERERKTNERVGKGTEEGKGRTA